MLKSKIYWRDPTTYSNYADWYKRHVKGKTIGRHR